MGNHHLEKLKVKLKVEVTGIEGLDTDISIFSARRKALAVRMECQRIDWTEVTLVMKKRWKLQRHVVS